jgi:hypothetical protein
MQYDQDEIVSLEKWLDRILLIAKETHKNAKNNKTKSFFLIATTGKQDANSLPYTTPLRQTEYGWLFGAIVFSQSQAVLAASMLDGKVDYIFVDAEKKLEMSFNNDSNIVEHFGIASNFLTKYNKNVEYGNISAACIHVVKKSIFHEYKPNDLTVEAAWTFISNHFKGLSGKKMAIIGGGNIGFKLALKLVESGVSVEFVRRSMEKGKLLVDAIDTIKPISTLATAHYNSNPIKASIECDALIGVTNGKDAISWEMIQSMKPDGIVVDIGKGTINKSVVEKAILKGINVIRCDVSAALSGVISTIIKNIDISQNKMGRAEATKGINIVSGGQFALEGDVIVDNINNPKNIYGISNGEGDIVIKIDNRQKAIISEIETFIEKKVCHE